MGEVGFRIPRVGFRIPGTGFRIPKPRIPDPKGKKMLDSGFRIPLHGATPTWIIFSSLTENCLASGWHISKSQRLLNLLRAPREVDWERHLSARRQMVLWCFAYDDLNYSRYLSADLSNVSHREEDHQKLGNTLLL